MPRYKTILSPEDQWAKTADMQMWPGESRTDGRAAERGFVLAPSDGEGRQRLRAIWHDPFCLTTVHVGQIQYNCREFCEGDLVLVMINNGGAERYPVYGVSSRGKHWRYRYVKVRRWNSRRYSGTAPRYRDSGPLKVLKHPGGLVGLRPVDPAVRAWVHESVLGAQTRPVLLEGSP